MISTGSIAAIASPGDERSDVGCRRCALRHALAIGLGRPTNQGQGAAKKDTIIFVKTVVSYDLCSKSRGRAPRQPFGANITNDLTLSENGPELT